MPGAGQDEALARLDGSCDRSPQARNSCSLEQRINFVRLAGWWPVLARSSASASLVSAHLGSRALGRRLQGQSRALAVAAFATALCAVGSLSPAVAEASSCGTVSLGGGGGVTFLARSISGGGMSCSSARREVRRGGVGAHGYQRYGGWRCTENTGLRYTCRKAGKSFSFQIVVRG